MKRMITLALVAAGFVATAQTPQILTPGDAQPIGGFEASATPTDTVDDFFVGQLTIIGYTGGGYFIGNNVDSDVIGEEAQGYVVLNPYTIEELMILVGGMADTLLSGDPNSKVTVKIRSLDGANGNPGTILRQNDLFFDDITKPTDSTVGITYFALNPTIHVTTDYAASFDFRTLSPGDTLGLVSTGFNEGQGDGYNWFQVNGTWRNFLADNNTDIDIAVFPIIDENGVGIEEFNFINGIKLGLPMPNPVVNTTTIEFELEQAGDASMLVYNMNGQEVINIQMNGLNEGKHSTTLDASNLPAGQYYYALTSGGQRVTKKMIVQ